VSKNAKKSLKETVKGLWYIPVCIKSLLIAWWWSRCNQFYQTYIRGIFKKI